MDGTSSAPTDAGVEGTMKTEWRINERMTNARPHPDPLPRHVFSGPDFSPSPPAEGGEGRGEEGFSACRRAGVSAVGLPSPRPFPRSFLTGRGSAVRAPNTHLHRGENSPKPIACLEPLNHPLTRPSRTPSPPRGGGRGGG